MEYSAGMVSCLFWFNETRKTAELLESCKDKSEIKNLAVEENIYQVSARARAIRIYGVAIKRLESLPESIAKQIVEVDISTSKLLVLISIMKTDRLFFEFVYEVYREAIILGENKITSKAIELFFDHKIYQSETVAKWSESAIKKLNQCYPKMLFEAGILKNTKGDKMILVPSMDYRTREMLEREGLGVYARAIMGED